MVEVDVQVAHQAKSSHGFIVAKKQENKAVLRALVGNFESFSGLCYNDSTKEMR
ncbi:hypothetical protein STRDD12_00903 [Streptococcus sp. DD12]|nr:hypothetical protein STRDD12_00903 [Streptococcus sp. DD12]